MISWTMTRDGALSATGNEGEKIVSKPKTRTARNRKAEEIIADLKAIRDTVAERQPVKLQWQLAGANAGAGANSPNARPERSEAEHAMEHAIDEINTLRRQNEVLRAKVETMDLFGAMLFSRPPESRNGMAEDVAWKLRRALDNLKAVKGVGQ